MREREREVPGERERWSSRMDVWRPGSVADVSGDGRADARRHVDSG